MVSSDSQKPSNMFQWVYLCGSLFASLSKEFAICPPSNCPGLHNGSVWWGQAKNPGHFDAQFPAVTIRECCPSCITWVRLGVKKGCFSVNLKLVLYVATTIAKMKGMRMLWVPGRGHREALGKSSWRIARKVAPHGWHKSERQRVSILNLVGRATDADMKSWDRGHHNSIPVASFSIPHSSHFKIWSSLTIFTSFCRKDAY